MQNLHSAELRQDQEPYLDCTILDDITLDAEDIGIKPAPLDQRKAFLARFPSNWSWDTIRRTIIIGWRKGLYPTNVAAARVILSRAGMGPGIGNVGQWAVRRSGKLMEVSK